MNSQPTYDRPMAKLRRIWALVRKESLQMQRDPSTLLIGILLPVVLILIFGYGLSLDVKNVPCVILLEDPSPEAMEVAAGFELSPYFKTYIVTDMPQAKAMMLNRTIDAIIRFRPDFARNVALGNAKVEVILHGSDANYARIIQGYAEGVINQWQVRRMAAGKQANLGPVIVQNRMWFNENANSHYFLVPGLIVIIMTLIGALLTSLVMAREWERGTLESLFATPVRVEEILLGKIIPYFALGCIGLTLCILSSSYMFNVPLRGSMLVLAGSSMLYLLVSLGMGLFISSATKNQFLASQIAVIVSFLPAMMLSGFVFDIRSMPSFVRFITHILPARYYDELLQTLFLAGNVWSIIMPNVAILALMAFVFLLLARIKTQKKLD